MTEAERLIQQAIAMRVRPDPAKITQTAAAREQPLGVPQHLRLGSRVRDPVTGQDGEVIGYGRAAWLNPPAAEAGGGGSAPPSG